MSFLRKAADSRAYKTLETRPRRFGSRVLNPAAAVAVPREGIGAIKQPNARQQAVNMAERPSPDSSIFSLTNTRNITPDDTVFYSIYPDSSSAASASASSLQSLHLEILNFLSPLISSYIWQHKPFTLSISAAPPVPHLHGHLRYGDNIEDEWFTVFLLFHLSSNFPSLSIRAWDSDGDFLLIEAAFHLPRWLNPDTSQNRVFIRRGSLHVIPKNLLPDPNLTDSLKFLISHGDEATRAPQAVQQAVKNRISEYPEKARKNTHCVRIRVPASVARVLKHEPCLISLAVEAFYDRDIDTMKHAARMGKFLPGGREEELVCVAVRMSRAMYAQLMQQKFQAPKCYPMPVRRDDDVAGYLEAELGMKIACGFEMMYQQRKREGEEGRGSTWQMYKETLEKSGYFYGLLPGSKEYKRLLDNAEEYYQKSSLFSRNCEMMNAPVRRIDEILALPHSADDFKLQEVPPSDDDSWLYSGEDELNTALWERQKEMDLYEAKHKKKQKAKEPKEMGASSSTNVEEFDLGDMAKAMQSFVDKVSSYKGAEVPENRNLKEVDLDVDRFLKDMESVLKRHGPEGDGSDVETEEASSSDMDFDESEDGSDIEEPLEVNGDGGDAFMNTYSEALNEELNTTTLKRSFIRMKDDEFSKKNEGTSNAAEVMDEDFAPVDVDINLVKSLLDSFSSQQGQPGPASNLLGLMGLKLPQEANKSK